MLSRPLRLAVQGLAVTGLVAGSVAFAQHDKSVDLVVDGKPRTVHVFGSTVGDVLRSEGLTVGEHDIVSPATSARVEDGTDVVVRYGRKLTVTLDGAQRDYWTTALSVDEALQQLGLRADSARLSVSRSLPLGRTGLALDMDTRKSVTLVVGGKRTVVTTYASTVGALLAERALTLGRLDTLSMPQGATIDDGAGVRLTRVAHKRTSRHRPLPFAVRSTRTDDLDTGRTKVITQGRPGIRKVTYEDTWTDGKRTARRVLRSVVVRAPQARVQQVGTRVPAPVAAAVRPSARPASRPASRPAARTPSSSVRPPSGGSGLNWAALAQCESGGNPRAVNPAGYYGLYQFSLSTWARVGGSGNPIDASPPEQLNRAKILYARAGAGQWGCGRHLFD